MRYPRIHITIPETRPITLSIESAARGGDRVVLTGENKTTGGAYTAETTLESLLTTAHWLSISAAPKATEGGGAASAGEDDVLSIPFALSVEDIPEPWILAFTPPDDGPPSTRIIGMTGEHDGRA